MGVLSSSKPVVHLKPSTTATRTSMLKLPSTQNPPHKRSVFLHPQEKRNNQKKTIYKANALFSRWFGYRFLIWNHVSDQSYSALSTKPAVTPQQIKFAVARIDL